MQFAFGRRAIRVNVASRAALLDGIADRIGHGRGFALATLNLDHLVKMRRDPAFLDAYAAHDLVVADGRPITWLARLAGERLDLVAGSDLVVPLARWAGERGLSVALVGSTQPSLDKAAAALKREIPGLEIPLRIAPSGVFDPDGDEARRILAQLRDKEIGMAFLALGAPKQERLAARGTREAPLVGFVSIGAGIDFLSGHQKRAPRVVRALALEWLWRTLKEPRRMVPRYAACFAILPGLAVSALAQRWR